MDVVVWGDDHLWLFERLGNGSLLGSQIEMPNASISTYYASTFVELTDWDHDAGLLSRNLS